MEIIKLTNPDYLGYVDVKRHACRGIIIKGDKILLGYERNIDQYIIPGGGVEDYETLIDCCKREVLEETGIICSPKEHYLDIEELFLSMKHINHYFVCELVDESNDVKLTEAEKEVDLTFIWMNINEAIKVFEQYEIYIDKNVARFGLYRREFLALKAYLNITNN